MHRLPLSSLLFSVLSLVLLPQAFAAGPQYVLAQPASVTVAGRTVPLASGQDVSVIGSSNGSTLIRVTLPDGSVSIAQVPTAEIRQVQPITPVAAPAPVTTAAPPQAAASPLATPAVNPPGQDEAGVASQFKYVAGAPAGGDVPLHKDWKLVWEDDFSMDQQIDRSKWNFEINGKGGGNGEKQYYTDSPKNAHIENGELVITVLKNDEGHRYTSARMTTKGKYSVLYGRIEACIKAPKAQMGNWPAFWMMPEESKYGGWPRSGELDIMELINKSDMVYGTAHFGGPGDIHKGAKTLLPGGGDFTTDYHVYAVEWEPKVLRWYLDGKYYGSINDWHSQNAPFPAPFDQKFFVILNYAVGGAWPVGVAHHDVPDSTATFPQSMHVKYVRVYQPG